MPWWFTSFSRNSGISTIWKVCGPMPSRPRSRRLRRQCPPAPQCRNRFRTRAPSPGYPVMNNFLSWFGRLALSLFLTVCVLLAPLQSSWAIFEEFQSLTAEKEKQIGEEFLLEIQQQIPLIEDPFLTSYL